MAARTLFLFQAPFSRKAQPGHELWIRHLVDDSRSTATGLPPHLSEATRAKGEKVVPDRSQMGDRLPPSLAFHSVHTVLVERLNSLTMNAQGNLIGGCRKKGNCSSRILVPKTLPGASFACERPSNHLLRVKSRRSSPKSAPCTIVQTMAPLERETSQRTTSIKRCLKEFSENFVKTPSLNKSCFVTIVTERTF
jgi:hypothetical protein